MPQATEEKLPVPFFEHPMAREQTCVASHEQTSVASSTRSAWCNERKERKDDLPVNLMRTSLTKPSSSSWHAVRTPTYHFSEPWPGDHQVHGRPTAWQPHDTGNGGQASAGSRTSAAAVGSTPAFNLDLRGTFMLTAKSGANAKVGCGEPSTGRTGGTETGGDSTDEDSWTPRDKHPLRAHLPELNSKIHKRPFPPTMQDAGSGEGTSTGIARRKSPLVHIASPIERDVLLEEIAVRPADAECFCVQCAMQPQHGGLPSLSLVSTWAKARHNAAATQLHQQRQKQQPRQQQLQQQLHKLQQQQQKLRSRAKLTREGAVFLNLRQEYARLHGYARLRCGQVGPAGCPVIESVTL